MLDELGRCKNKIVSLPPDIIQKIKNDFPKKEEYDLVESTLKELEVDGKNRVIRCILFVASGDLKKLAQLEELAIRDYRDVIMAGEYEYPSSKRLRNLANPF